jgi:hypothetical protein
MRPGLAEEAAGKMSNPPGTAVAEDRMAPSLFAEGLEQVRR